MPIPLEVLRRVSVVYTHKSCPDGMASAMILRDAFRMLGTSPRIELLAHGTSEHKSASMGDQDGYALWCDIAPVAHELLNESPGEFLFIVLDHHKGAEDIVRSFGELGIFADEALEPGVSGAVLAFWQVWDAAFDVSPNNMRKQVEDFALCVGARDTWQTQDSRFQRGQWISKMLMSKPADYWLGSQNTQWGCTAKPPYLSESEILAGRALFEAHEEAVRQAVDQCVAFELVPSGHDVTLFVFQEQASGFRLTSDVAESLRRDFFKIEGYKGVVAGFSYVVDKPGGEPRLLYSLRGLSGFDVAAFAKANGGGGHTAAAGFSVPLGIFGEPEGQATTPYDYIQHRLDAFLRA